MTSIKSIFLYTLQALLTPLSFKGRDGLWTFRYKITGLGILAILWTILYLYYKEGSFIQFSQYAWYSLIILIWKAVAIILFFALWSSSAKRAHDLNISFGKLLFARFITDYESGIVPFPSCWTNTSNLLFNQKGSAQANKYGPAPKENIHDFINNQSPVFPQQWNKNEVETDDMEDILKK